MTTFTSFDSVQTYLELLGVRLNNTREARLTYYTASDRMMTVLNLIHPEDLNKLNFFNRRTLGKVIQQSSMNDLLMSI